MTKDQKKNTLSFGNETVVPMEFEEIVLILSLLRLEVERNEVNAEYWIQFKGYSEAEKWLAKSIQNKDAAINLYKKLSGGANL